MAAFLLLVLLASAVTGWPHIRYSRSTDNGPAGSGGSLAGAGAGAGSGAFSSASSSSFSSSSGTKVAPGPGGYGNFNAFSGMSSFGPPLPGADFQPLYRGGAGAGSSSQSGFPGSQGAAGFPGSQGGYPGSQGEYYGSQGGYSSSQGGFPGFQGFPGSQGGYPSYNPFVPQYGQQYPWMPFPNYAAPFDFMTFLNQYFQSLQSFQSQAEAQAQQAASSGAGLPIDTNEVGGVGGFAGATYGPQGGYGNAEVFPKPEGGLETRFGAEDEPPQNSLGGGPISTVSGNFKPPGSSSFGVFTSSASGSSDINGKKTNFKQSSVSVNDNGKVTTYTAHDP